MGNMKDKKTRNWISFKIIWQQCQYLYLFTPQGGLVGSNPIQFPTYSFWVRCGATSIRDGSFFGWLWQILNLTATDCHKLSNFATSCPNLPYIDKSWNMLLKVAKRCQIWTKDMRRECSCWIPPDWITTPVWVELPQLHLQLTLDFEQHPLQPGREERRGRTMDVRGGESLEHCISVKVCCVGRMWKGPLRGPLALLD